MKILPKNLSFKMYFVVLMVVPILSMPIFSAEDDITFQYCNCSGFLQANSNGPRLHAGTNPFYLHRLHSTDNGFANIKAEEAKDYKAGRCSFSDGCPIIDHCDVAYNMTATVSYGPVGAAPWVLVVSTPEGTTTHNLAAGPVHDIDLGTLEVDQCGESDYVSIILDAGGEIKTVVINLFCKNCEPNPN